MIEDQLSESNVLVPIVDTPATKPAMGFEERADVLASLLKNAEPARLTIGIFGGYGSGKTTLMQTIAKKLKEGEDLLAVGFNAWRYDNEEHLFLPFLSAILRKVKQEPSVARYAWTALYGAIRSISLKFNVKFFETNLELDKAFKASDEALKGNIQKATDCYIDIYNEIGQLPLGDEPQVKLQRKIVIFIDDLDRCVPKKAFGLLEALKSFMDIEGLMFVIGLDPRAIETYLSDKYGSTFCVTAEEYLQKMVQIPVYLASHETSKLADFLVDELKRNHSSNWSIQMRKVLSAKTGLVAYFPKNLRQAKRILNTHQVISATKENAGIEPDLLLTLLIVKTRWPVPYWAMYSYRKNFHNEVKACREGNDKLKLYKRVKDHSQLLNKLLDETFWDFYNTFILSKIKLDECEYFGVLGFPIGVESRLE
jgi:RecA/RadA recombinase